MHHRIARKMSIKWIGRFHLMQSLMQIFVTFGVLNAEMTNLLCLDFFFLQESFQRLLHKQDGTRAEWEYPFAVAGINISFMLAQMLDLQSG